MIAEKLVDILPFKSEFAKLASGAIITALAISVGMVYLSEAIGFHIGPALPSAFAAIGTAIFASRVKEGIVSIGLWR